MSEMSGSLHAPSRPLFPEAASVLDWNCSQHDLGFQKNDQSCDCLEDPETKNFGMVGKFSKTSFLAERSLSSQKKSSITWTVLLFCRLA